jgi:hypothetical protein
MTTTTIRNRTDGGYTYPLAVYTSYNGVTNQSTANVFGNGTYSTCVDYVTKGFQKAQERGEVVMNPWQKATRTKTSQAITYADVHRTGNPSQWYRYSGGPWTRLTHGVGSTTDLVPKIGTFLFSYDDVNRIAVEASTNVLSQIGRASTDTWENLAEIRKTLTMLWSPLKSWFQFERKARAASLGLSASNAWLMYRYGIRPLVGSINDVMVAVGRGIRNERVSSRAQRVISVSRNKTFTHSTDGILASVTENASESIIVRAMSLDELTTDWRYQYGFDAKSLMTLPWNLVGYSFVVDWFVNVGDLIGSLGQAFYPQSLGRCITTQQVASVVQDGTTVGWAPGYTVNSPGRSVIREDLVRKERAVGLTSPGLVVKSNFKLDDFTRLADATTLVSQQLLSRFLRANVYQRSPFRRKKTRLVGGT